MLVNHEMVALTLGVDMAKFDGFPGRFPVSVSL
jgi:hypothetical protein